MYIAIAAVAGLILGFFIAFVIQGKKIATLQTALGDVREELDHTRRESSSKLEEERSKAKLMKKELAQYKAQAKLQRETAEQVTRLKAEVARLREGLKKAEDGRIAAEQLAANHRAKAEDAESRFKQSQSAGTQWQQRAEQLEEQALAAEQEVASLKQLLDRKDRELKLAQTAATIREETEGGRRTRPTSELFVAAGDDLEQVLRVLIESEEQRVAVLADTNGIVVAASGDATLKEGMAATSQLVEGLTRQLDGMVPFSQLRSFVLQDNMSNVLAGRTFECAGETVGLATYGPRLPAERVVKGAMNNLGTILG